MTYAFLHGSSLDRLSNFCTTRNDWSERAEKEERRKRGNIVR